MSGEEPATQIAPVESPQMVSTVKLPILKKGEYTLWSMRMKQYLTNTDYSLWQVILNDDGPIQVTTNEKGIETEVPLNTAQALLQIQRERKAKSILLLAILDEYQLRFHGIKDAKSLWAAIKSRFGGNVKSKKMQKTVLKQQFENFSVSDTEGLDKAFDRNKDGIDDLDIDDLYNNLKVFEADIKGSFGSSSNSQNVAFLYAEYTSRSNEVNTANSVSTASGHNSQGQTSSSSYTNDLMFSFFANQSNSPQLDDEDLEQIDHDDLEEMDLKWQVAMLSMRVKRFCKKTGRKLIFNGKEPIEFHQLVDFLSTCSINYALTVSPTIYASYIEQFWNTTTSKIINSVKQIHAIVDGKAVVISESLVRSDLLFNDEDGVTCLTNDEIFENLALMGYEQLSTKLTFQKGSFSPQWKFLIHTILHCISSKSTAWNEFSTNLASAVICLAKGQKFNFSKLIFDGMLRNLDSKKFLMYPRFLQLFLNNQIKDLPEPFNDTYVTPCHTKKVFSNMARKIVNFSRNITSLFASMLVQNQAPEGEGSAIHPEPQPTPSTSQPNVSEPQIASLHIETSPTIAPQTVAHQPAVSQIVFHEAYIEQILPSLTTYQRIRKTQKCRRTKKDTELP
ncbi:hypothetical protein Tco_1327561 [Tanacetum coccineum]